MELSAVLAILRRWSVTLIGSAVVAGVVAYAVASQVPPTYAAEAQVLVGPINTDENTLAASSDLVQTYGQLVTTDRVLGSVIESLDLGVDARTLGETITARPESVTRILTIEALAGDPDTAAAIANEIVAALERLVGEEQVRPEGAVTVVTAAQANPDPIAPQVSVIVVLAATAGLVAALGVVLLIDYFGNAVSGRHDLQQLTGAPFLGAIFPGRRFRPRPDRPLIVDAEPDSGAALAYRLVASRISGGDATGALRSVVVLGAEGHEGSGEVAANLAAVLAQGGRSVRLVDANEISREVTRLFGLNPTYHLGELGHADDGLLDRMSQDVPPGMKVVPLVPGRDPRLTDAKRALVVLDRLATDVDVVVLDAAPIHRSASALLWARHADGALLVTRRDKTKRDQVAFTAETLRTIGTPLLGTVFHARRTSTAAGGESERAHPVSPMAVRADEAAGGSKRAKRP